MNIPTTHRTTARTLPASAAAPVQPGLGRQTMDRERCDGFATTSSAIRPATRTERVADDGVRRPRTLSIRRQCVRLARGWYCRMRLDRNDAAPMVHTLCDFGEPFAAIAAAKSAMADNPQNVYTYLHIIDIAVRDAGHFKRARKYYRLGVATLTDPDDRELLESFYLYTRMVNKVLF